MVSLSGPTTANITEGLNGGGNITASGTVANNEPGIYSWLPGGYTILSAPTFGTLTITQNTANGEGGYTWSFVVDSDDPALDGLDRGDSLDITFNVRVTDVSFNAANGFASTVNGTAVIDTHQVTITIFGENEVCFARGTEILTEAGPRKIEALKVGDKVVTRDRGAQPIRWIASSKISKERRRGNSQLEPIAIEPDTFSPGVPSKRLLLSPQHRILVENANLAVLFGESSALVSAKNLKNSRTVYSCGDEVEDLEYWHLALDSHEVVYAENCPVESLHFGDEVLSTLNPAQLVELNEIFPGLIDQSSQLSFPELRSFEGQLISHGL
ncbi:MAG: Hint domain-containing protein [Pseudomonadota bacterium]